MKVGVIGGGIAGLSCAVRLQQLGLAVTVYDTGKRGPGGRCSSRIWRGRPVDHAAQFAEARTEPFAEFLSSLEREGKARRLKAEDVATLAAPGIATPSADAIPRYVGVGGMGAISDALTACVEDVRTDTWVSPNGGIRRNAGDGSWLVKESKTVESRYDAVVVAHNGKCAERLTSRQPSKAVHSLLRTRFAPTLPKQASPGGGRMTLNSIYSLLLELPAGLIPADRLGVCNFVECEPSIRMIVNNGAKHADTDAETELWTVLSSGRFGKKHKAAQEFLEGTEVESEVTRLLLSAVGRSVGMEEGSLSEENVIASKLQLWGAAVPISSWTGGPCVWDADHTIGICGDWMHEAPAHESDARSSTIESAWMSGRALAEHVANTETRGSSCGLELGEAGGHFVPVDGGGFGEGGKAGAAGWVALPGQAGGAKAGGAKRAGGATGGDGACDQLFVVNVPYATSEGDMQSHFDAAAPGKVVSVQMLQTREGRARGMARVRMRSIADARAAFESLDGKELDGRPLRVSYDERRRKPSGRSRA